MIQMRRNRTPDASKRAVVEGVVDGLANGLLRGWAWFPGSPDASARVAIHSDGKLLPKWMPRRFAPIWQRQGKRAGQCAFELALRSLPGLGSTISVTVETPDGARELAGSPLTVPESLCASRSVATPDVLPLPMSTVRLRGSLDACGPTRIRGWAFWLDDRQRPVTLRLLEGDHEWLRFEATSGALISRRFTRATAAVASTYRCRRFFATANCIHWSCARSTATYRRWQRRCSPGQVPHRPLHQPCSTLSGAAAAPGRGWHGDAVRDRQLL